jgi:hypothetical protein
MASSVIPAISELQMDFPSFGFGVFFPVADFHTPHFFSLPPEKPGSTLPSGMKRKSMRLNNDKDAIVLFTDRMR